MKNPPEMRTAEVTMPAAVDGRAEVALRAQLADALSARPQELVLDFAPTEFFGATGVTLLVSTWRQLRQHDGALLLRSPSQLTQRVLCLVGFDGLAGVAIVEGSTMADTVVMTQSADLVLP